jgi:hypothetical protein
MGNLFSTQQYKFKFAPRGVGITKNEALNYLQGDLDNSDGHSTLRIYERNNSSGGKLMYVCQSRHAKFGYPIKWYVYHYKLYVCTLGVRQQI